MKDNLARLYPALEPRERFLLTLDAMARGDDKELDRLAESCPRRSYTMRDQAFTRLAQTSMDAATLFYTAWLEGRWRLDRAQLVLRGLERALDTGRDLWLAGMRASWELAGGKGECPLIEEYGRAWDEKLARPEWLREAREEVQQATAWLRGIHEGMLRFCGEVDIEPERLLAWHPSLLKDIERIRGELADAPAHEEAAAEIYRLWASLLSGLPTPRGGHGRSLGPLEHDRNSR